MKLRILFYNIFIGVPGGALIFMSTLMFNALLGKLVSPAAWTMLLFLCVDAFLVGLLARWFRPYHGLGAAVASGAVAALILFVLWRVSPSAPETSLAVGPVGMAAALVFSTLGGWVFSRRKGEKA